jgi:plasmid stability protein
MGQIRYEIPDDLHRALKSRAALEGVTVKELLIRLLSEALGEGDSGA